VLKYRSGKQRPKTRLGHGLFVAEMLETGGLRALYWSAETFKKSKSVNTVCKLSQQKKPIKKKHTEE